MGIPDTEFVIADPVVPGGSRNSDFRYNFILFHQPAVGFLHHFPDRFSAFAGYDLRIHCGKDGCHIGGVHGETAAVKAAFCLFLHLFPRKSIGILQMKSTLLLRAFRQPGGF